MPRRTFLALASANSGGAALAACGRKIEPNGDARAHRRANQGGEQRGGANDRRSGRADHSRRERAHRRADCPPRRP